MKTTYVIAALLAICGSGAIAADAQAYSERVKSACRDDYCSYCSAYAVESTGMRRCLEANGNALSRRCVNAMADEGEISRKFKR